MTGRIGRVRNTSDESIVTTYTVNDTNAVAISVPYDQRTKWSVSMNHGVTDVTVYIREYPAALDNLKHGEVLTRINSGNDTVFNLTLKGDADNPYTGEYSAITESGSVDVHVTERRNN